ncbi:MAG: CHAT domain-containing protein [Aureispira sp.]|nr:CHAT domain-containing protein [Aureispira sp.]
MAINDLAYFYEFMDKLEDVEPLYLRALEIRGEVYGKNDFKYAETLNNLAYFYESTGRFEEAESLRIEVELIIKSSLGTDNFYYAGAIHNLSAVYRENGKYLKAKEACLMSMSIVKKIAGEGHFYYATGLDNLASIYMDMEKYEEAEPWLLKALEITKSALGEGHTDYAAALNNLAKLYNRIGKNNEAEELFFRAMHTIKSASGKKHALYITALNNIGAYYKSVDKLDTAYAYFMLSIASNSTNFNQLLPNYFSIELDSIIEESVGSKCSRTDIKHTTYLKLASLDYRHSVEIIESFQQLLLVVRAQYDQLMRGGSVVEDAQSAKILQKYYALAKVAMAINEDIRSGFAGKKNRLRVSTINGDIMKHGIDAALALAKPEYHKEAFSFAEQNKSILLSDAIKGHRARILGDLPDSLVLQELNLEENKDRILKAKYNASNDDEKAMILAEENELNLKIEAFGKSLKNKYPKYHALKYEKNIAEAADVQALLEPQTILLEYFMTDTMTYLFAVTAKEVNVYPIAIEKADLKIKIRTLRQALIDYNMIIDNPEQAYQLYTKNANWFYKTFLAPVLVNKDIQNIVIVADGELGHLPFETFLVEPAPSETVGYDQLHYLVKDYNIAYNYSATLWKENLEAKQHKNNGEFLACAAAYSNLDSSLTELRAPYIVETRTHLNPLPSAQNEVRALEKLFKGVFLQEEASNEHYFKENAHQYGVIHLAMHGILNARQPILSSLAFTENRDSLDDNFLQAYEISHLKLNADLVVLSACETGYGKFEQGEGIISLARSFMYAGVPSLVVSLWQVNDKSTAEIMEFFYKNLATGMDKSKALRQAKLEYLKKAQDIAAHPAFWSPFIQLGDSKSIELAQKGNDWIWWIVGALGLAILLGLGVKMARTKELI